MGESNVSKSSSEKVADSLNASRLWYGTSALHNSGKFKVNPTRRSLSFLLNEKGLNNGC
jgi:hypothetical protein|tara:strand:+ start:137 stop:313 length:177 start_codon:yes stop_codon:yes gene_type:complete